MPDRAFFSLAALTAILLIAIAFVWPQGLGRRSPGPFGHETASQIAARTPQLRPGLAGASLLPPPVASPALAPEPSSVPAPMAMPAPAPAAAAPPIPAPAPSNTVQP